MTVEQHLHPGALGDQYVRRLPALRVSHGRFRRLSLLLQTARLWFRTLGADVVVLSGPAGTGKTSMLQMLVEPAATFSAMEKVQLKTSEDALEFVNSMPLESGALAIDESSYMHDPELVQAIRGAKAARRKLFIVRQRDGGLAARAVELLDDRKTLLRQLRVYEQPLQRQGLHA
jgi:hypothetical protein